jgi:hypothetical protein
MFYSLIIRIFICATTALSVGVLFYVYTFPLESTRTSKNGVPFFSPSVTHPETGKALDVNLLVRHYKGE